MEVRGDKEHQKMETEDSPLHVHTAVKMRRSAGGDGPGRGSGCARPRVEVDDLRFLCASDRSFAGLGRKGRAGRRDQGWDGNFWFAQLADTQLGLYDEAGSTWHEEMEMIHGAAKAINAVNPRPAFVCVCGDLTNSMPNGRGADPELQARQVVSFKEAMSAFAEDIPLVCVCGNHDVGDRPSKLTIERYKSWFGDDYFSFWHGGCKFVVVNSSLHSALEDGRYSLDLKADGTGGALLEEGESAESREQDLREATAMAVEQDLWLERVLEGEGGEDGGGICEDRGEVEVKTETELEVGVEAEVDWCADKAHKGSGQTRVNGRHKGGKIEVVGGKRGVISEGKTERTSKKGGAKRKANGELRDRGGVA